jgi:hypothetical protein
MIIRIEEFLKTAEFGPITIGTSKDKTLSLLGAPDDDTDLDGPGSIPLYAWYELFYDHNNTLKSIQNDNYDPTDKKSYFFKNEKFEIDPWFLNEKSNQNIEDISSLLADANIPYQKLQYHGRVVLQTQSGVIVDFDEEENEVGVKALMGIRYWPK